MFLFDRENKIEEVQSALASHFIENTDVRVMVVRTQPSDDPDTLVVEAEIKQKLRLTELILDECASGKRIVLLLEKSTTKAFGEVYHGNVLGHRLIYRAYFVFDLDTEQIIKQYNPGINDFTPEEKQRIRERPDSPIRQFLETQFLKETNPPNKPT